MSRRLTLSVTSLESSYSNSSVPTWITNTTSRRHSSPHLQMTSLPTSTPGMVPSSLQSASILSEIQGIAVQTGLSVPSRPYLIDSVLQERTSSFLLRTQYLAIATTGGVTVVTMTVSGITLSKLELFLKLAGLTHPAVPVNLEFAESPVPYQASPG
jgi:hypothetical protein